MSKRKYNHTVQSIAQQENILKGLKLISCQDSTFIAGADSKENYEEYKDFNYNTNSTVSSTDSKDKQESIEIIYEIKLLPQSSPHKEINNYN